MLPAPAKILVYHAISLTIAAGSVVLLLGRHLNGSAADVASASLRIFWGLFAVGALVLGVGGLFKAGLLVTKGLRAGGLNSGLIRESTGSVIFYAAEVCFALSVLGISGFLHFGVWR